MLLLSLYHEYMPSYNCIPRSVEQYVFDETLTGRHVVFLAGPRQVGKTRLAKQRLEKRRRSPLYYNWDDIATRQAYLADSRFFDRRPGFGPKKGPSKRCKKETKKSQVVNMVTPRPITVKQNELPRCRASRNSFD